MRYNFLNGLICIASAIAIYLFLRKFHEKEDELDNFGEIFYDPNLVPFLINLNNAFENTYLHSNNRILSRRDEQEAIETTD